MQQFAATGDLKFSEQGRLSHSLLQALRVGKPLCGGHPICTPLHTFMVCDKLSDKVVDRYCAGTSAAGVTVTALPAGTKEFSPVVIAAVVAGGVTTGAVLLNSGVLLTEEAITSTLQNGGSALTQGTTELAEGITIDANTKLLLNVAFALLGLGSVVIGTPNCTSNSTTV